MNSPSAHSQPVPDSSADALLDRMERVRALAGQLVRQAADQEDIVQEAIARALAKPREISGDPDPWIRRVMRNLAIDRQRSAARRQTHEASAVDGTAVQESTADSIARAERQRDLVTAVLQLKEPYRAVILQRFFDGLPPREIAKRQGVPVATVKKHQERGMAMLRKELESRYGGEGSWAVALLPILPRSALKSLGAGSVAGSLGGASLGWTIPLAAAVLVGVGWWAIRALESSQGEVEPGGHESLVATSDVADRTQPMESDVRTFGGRSPGLDAAADLGANERVAAVQRRVFTGTFVDESGAPVVNVSAVCRIESSLGASEGDPSRGSDTGVVVASIEAAPDALMIVDVEAAGYAPARFRFRPPASDEELSRAAVADVGLQTLYSSADLAVRVVDPRGATLLGWEMSYFHYGGGDRLEWGRATADPITGRAEFRGIAAVEVEVIAEHPSGVSIHHPRRLLSGVGPNTIDLVHVGVDPSRRIGVDLAWPATASGAGGAPVEIALISNGERLASSRVPLSEENTSFDDLEPGNYTLSVDDPRFEVTTAAAVPGESVRVRLKGNARLRLSVDDSEGRSVTDYALELSSGVDGSMKSVRLRQHASPLPTGGVFEGLLPDRDFAIRVTASDGRQAACRVSPLLALETRVLSLTLGEGMTPIGVSAIRSGDDDPVAGADVAVFDRPIPPGSRLEQQALALVGGAEPIDSLRLLARGSTDATGKATLMVASHDDTGTLTALVVASDHAFGSVVGGTARITLSAQGTVRVVPLGLPAAVGQSVASATPSATPSATTPATGLPAGVALTLVSPSSIARYRALFGPGIVMEPDGSGAFATTLAPQGPATIWLCFSDFNHTGRGTTLGGITGPVGYPLKTVEVPAGVLTELDVDVSELWPGSLEVVAKHAGQALGDAVVQLEPVGSHAHLPIPVESGTSVSRVLTRLTDGAGRARFPRVPKGLWRIRVRDSGWQWASDAGECEIRSGESERRELTIELAEGEVTILDAITGSPLCNGEVLVEVAPGVRMARSTDAAGRIRLRLGRGNYRVTTTARVTDPSASALLEWGIDGPLHSSLALE